ncbi:MAG: hypothetical protein QOH04_1441 [Sphingomonadales bacterium]|nr:hypothetical protein [Sphingomonadales bacterium]
MMPLPAAFVYAQADSDEAKARRADAVPEQPKKDDADGDEEDEGRPETPLIVTARRLDAARTQIDAALGATVYELDNETIEDRPGGETGSVAATLLQAPGGSLSAGGLTLRGSRALQVRINDVILPVALSDPADHLSSRLAQTTRLITGTLPAQFGFAPGGVISVTTKNGLYQHGGQAEFFAASDGAREPAFEWAGSAAGTSLFTSGSLQRDRSLIGNSSGPGNDLRHEVEAFAFADHVLSSEDRLSFILGASRERHRIGQTHIPGGTLGSDDGYVSGSFQHSVGGFTVQASLSGADAWEQAQFDRRTREDRTSLAVQADASYKLGPNLLRTGLLLGRSTQRESRDGSPAPRLHRTSAGVYGQIEWTVAPALTLDTGVRGEWLRGLASAFALEPRASLVWSVAGGLTVHAGYARYAAAPPLEVVRSAHDLSDERDDYFDAGAQQKVGPLTLALDGYWRFARNLLVERKDPDSAVPMVFGFAHARLRGLDLSASFRRGPMAAWLNLGLSSARGRTILPGEIAFAPATLAAAAHAWVPLGSERPFTASGGLTWCIGRLSLSGDLQASSGAVRTASADAPNGSRSSAFLEAGIAAVYHLRIAGRPTDLRVDITNLTDVRYLWSDRSALEGDWSRFGRRRAVTFGIERSF